MRIPEGCISDQKSRENNVCKWSGKVYKTGQRLIESGQKCLEVVKNSSKLVENDFKKCFKNWLNI
jgi:hypothetical protein